jgi:hypothetical protein
MDTIGDADNAVIEAFCGRMQTELLDRRRLTTRVELANAIFLIESPIASTVVQQGQPGDHGGVCGVGLRLV